MPTSPLPIDVPIEEIERHLDRLAVEIVESPYGQDYVPLFVWLEDQLQQRQNLCATMDVVRRRVARLEARL